VTRVRRRLNRLLVMNRLIHFRFCPRSRSIRLALVELDITAELQEERPWEWRSEFLAQNPAGELPVLILPEAQPLCGTYAIAEYLDEGTIGDTVRECKSELFPGTAQSRAEVRRLADWFHNKCHMEATDPILDVKVYGRLRSDGARAPDLTHLRSAQTNLRHHLRYINHLAHQRSWLAGDAMSFADLAAAAHVSVMDYLGEVPWDDVPAAKSWYMRIKSRPSFRALLADRLPGMAPHSHYAELDF
jgi:glutathione S-transferase